MTTCLGGTAALTAHGRRTSRSCARSVRSKVGSLIGDGVCASKSSPTAAITGHISGYIRVCAESLESARELVVGNPIYEAGGTVEIRELPAAG